MTETPLGIFPVANVGPRSGGRPGHLSAGKKRRRSSQANINARYCPSAKPRQGQQLRQTDGSNPDTGAGSASK